MPLLPLRRGEGARAGAVVMAASVRVEKKECGVAVFFTADSHFGHANIIRHCNRPFASAWVMDAALVEKWNAVVGEDDDVYHLGDFAYGCRPEYALNIALDLNGTKYLVPGGHDHCKTGRKLDGAFCILPPLVTRHYEGTPLVLCHYPLASWWNSGRGAIMLHGHSHGKMARVPGRIDVGVDSCEFRPVGLDEVLATCRGR